MEEELLSVLLAATVQHKFKPSESEGGPSKAHLSILCIGCVIEEPLRRISGTEVIVASK